MTKAQGELFDRVLSLPEDVRLNLVDKLLNSLNMPTQGDIDELWAKEAERRVREIDKGEVELIPGEEVFTKLQRKYGQ